MTVMSSSRFVKCKVIICGIHRASLFNKFETISSIVRLSADLIRILASGELKPLPNSWKHEIRSLYKRRYSTLWVFNNLSRSS